MSDEQPVGSDHPTYTRRAALGLGAATVAGVALGSGPAGALAAGSSTTEPSEPDSSVDSPPDSPLGSPLDSLRPEIATRAAWGADLPVAGPIEAEDDVRFLLVHHTASTNDYGPDDVVDQIRGFYRFHTSAEKGWPDVAYNFFVDRFGGIWEARQGSLAGPVRGDATGGSQGFALLCSLIGDHSQVPLSEAALNSLVSLLAWLAERHGLATDPGATTDFVSRGSNRWAEGTAVTAATISGHRDMSQTSCPGDFAYGLLAEDLPRAVTDLRARVVAAVPASTIETEAEPAATLVMPSSDDPGPTAVESAGTAATGDVHDGEAAPTLTGRAVDDDGLWDDPIVPTAVAGGVAAAAAAGAAAARRRRRGPASRTDSGPTP